MTGWGANQAWVIEKPATQARSNRRCAFCMPLLDNYDRNNYIYVCWSIETLIYIYTCTCILYIYILMIVQSPLAISIYQPRCLGACCRSLHFHSVTCSSRFSVTPILEDHTLPQVQMLRPGLKKQSSGSSGSRDMSSHEFARRLGWFRHRFRIVSDNHRLRLSLSRLWMICRIVSSSVPWSTMSNHNDMLWYTLAIPANCKCQIWW